MTTTVAIATGDPAGIGPEISLKAARDPSVTSICRPVLVGDRGVLQFYARGLGFSLDDYSIVERRQFTSEKFKPGEISAAHGRAAVDSAETAVRGALAGEFHAVVGAPHTETAIHAAGIEFDGYPSFVAKVAGRPAEDGILMLCFAHEGREIRIAHVTLHTSVLKALQAITKERILKTLRAVNEALKKMGIEKPKLAVSGVNPHAGEGGLFGSEELEIVYPAVEAAREEGMIADGPIGADTLFQRVGYDAYLAMLHDQGHVAAKLLAPNRAAGLAIGTPVLFSSVGHGSALDIAGQGRADPRAMVEAITRLVGQRRRPAAT
jgi:4-hydroxythreonine-4-phosphate dehydrogenase